MKSLKPLICASLLTVALSTSTMAGNIGGLKTSSAGNIGGLRTNRVGNIGGLSTGNRNVAGAVVPDAPRSRFELTLIENLGSFLSILIAAY